MTRHNTTRRSVTLKGRESRVEMGTKSLSDGSMQRKELFVEKQLAVYHSILETISTMIFARQHLQRHTLDDF